MKQKGEIKFHIQMNKNKPAHIVAAASAFPNYYYSQEEITTAMRKLWMDRPSSLERLAAFHENMQINGRYLTLPLEEYLHPSGFGERNRVWTQIALDLAEKAIKDLLAQVNLEASEIDLIAFTTITGVAAPSIDARLMNRIPFSPYLKRMPLFGFGCMGGASGIARLTDYLVGHPKEAALLLSVELCSLTIQHNDLSAENMVSTGLFGDGAAAVLMVGAQHALAKKNQPRVIDTRSVFFPDTEYIMGWEMCDTGFKVVLSSDVVQLVETSLCPAINDFLIQYGTRSAEIEHWLVHPGGPKIIQAIETGLGLKNGALDRSREILASVGNLSSAAVLVMLEKALQENISFSGSCDFMMAMGPAFNAELILLEW